MSEQASCSRLEERFGILPLRNPRRPQHTEVLMEPIRINSPNPTHRLFTMEDPLGRVQRLLRTEQPYGPAG